MAQYRVKLTVVVGAQSQAEALKRLQDVIEPPGVSRIQAGAYIETTDRIEVIKGA